MLLKYYKGKTRHCPLVTEQQFVTLDHNGKHNNQPSYENTHLHVRTCMCRKKILYQNSIASQLQKREF